MTILTQSYDDAVYKLAPVDPMEAMLHAAVKCRHSDATYKCTLETVEEGDAADDYRAVLTAVPADLPGVVTHSGKPVGYLCVVDGQRRGTFDSKVDAEKFGVARKFPYIGEELYTHADPAEVEQLRQRVTQLDGEVERYRKGMANWKATAEEKDRQFAAQLAQQDGAQPVAHRLASPELKAQINEAAKAGHFIFESGWNEGAQPATDAPTPEAVVKAALEVASEKCMDIEIVDKTGPNYSAWSSGTADCSIAIDGMRSDPVAITAIIQAAREGK